MPTASERVSDALRRLSPLPKRDTALPAVFAPLPRDDGRPGHDDWRPLPRFIGDAAVPWLGAVPDDVWLVIIALADLPGVDDAISGRERLLEQVEQRLPEAAAPWPVLRYGESEFMVAARLPSEASLRVLTQRVRALVEDVVVDGVSPRTCAVAVHPAPAAELGALLTGPVEDALRRACASREARLTIVAVPPTDS